MAVKTCVCCGKSLGPFSGRIKYKLKDPDTLICRSCWKSLGFDTTNADVMAKMYAWEDIKDGARAYYARRIVEHAAAWDEDHPSPVSISSNYDDINPTVKEAELYELLIQALIDNARDPEPMKMIRKASSYLTAAFDEIHDVCRFKYTERAKWIQFPYSMENGGKRYIEAVALTQEDVEALLKSYDLALINSGRPTYRPHSQNLPIS